jgi:hypothetical protein
MVIKLLGTGRSGRLVIRTIDLDFMRTNTDGFRTQNEVSIVAPEFRITRAECIERITVGLLVEFRHLGPANVVQEFGLSQSFGEVVMLLLLMLCLIGSIHIFLARLAFLTLHLQLLQMFFPGQGFPILLRSNVTHEFIPTTCILCAKTTFPRSWWLCLQVHRSVLQWVRYVRLFVEKSFAITSVFGR